MTEQDWMASTDPYAMLSRLVWWRGPSAAAQIDWRAATAGAVTGRHPLVTERKLRLFAVACHREMRSQLKHLLGDVDSVDLALAVADDQSKHSQVVERWNMRGEQGVGTWSILHPSALRAALTFCSIEQVTSDEYMPVRAALMKEVFGNPFRKCPAIYELGLAIIPEAITIAAQMYNSQDFTDAPILADALEDSDCRDEYVLDHLRNPSQKHCRGCWAVDLVLGKR